MTAQSTAPLVLIAVPILTALFGLFMWRSLQPLKIWLLIASVVSLGTIVWAAGALPAHSGGVFLLSLLPVMAFVTLLGQPLHAGNAPAWLLTLLLTGLGFGALASATAVSLVCFLLLLAVVGLILFHYRARSGSDAWWGIGTLGLGVISVGVALIGVPSVSVVAFTVACAVAFPLVPFHKGYTSALTGLPGNLPSFLALLLPVIGFHGLTAVLPLSQDALTEAVGVLALLGTLYGSLKALVQSRAASVVAYGSLAFLSILWWALVIMRDAGPQTVVYLSAVSLATSGLLIAWYMLRARYGEIGLRALSGLAEPMPRFAIAVSLLAFAAIGLPPFGVFSGFMGLLLAPTFTWTGGLIVIIIAWLSASWYLFDLVQGLLFGRCQTERRHEDLGEAELTSLAIVLVLLVALGVMPTRLFDVKGHEPGTDQRTAVMEFRAWNK
ncbi:MAG TPA: proton-conducting transporter membrane subunit [Nitrospiraceae bacterium]|nr:proton-conducting transporter membrane subunit [Nitrospiraceae bacterium]